MTSGAQCCLSGRCNSTFLSVSDVAQYRTAAFTADETQTAGCHSDVGSMRVGQTADVAETGAAVITLQLHYQ